MKLFIDTEYNSGGGALISLAMIGERDVQWYNALKWEESSINPWVARHVMPNLMIKQISMEEFLKQFVKFLLGLKCKQLEICYTAKEDGKHFRQLVRSTDGKLNDIEFQYSKYAIPKGISLESAIPHNALADATALVKLVREGKALYCPSNHDRASYHSGLYSMKREPEYRNQWVVRCATTGQYIDCGKQRGNLASQYRIPVE